MREYSFNWKQAHALQAKSVCETSVAPFDSNLRKKCKKIKICLGKRISNQWPQYDNFCISYTSFIKVSVVWRVKSKTELWSLDTEEEHVTLWDMLFKKEKLLINFNHRPVTDCNSNKMAFSLSRNKSWQKKRLLILLLSFVSENEKLSLTVQSMKKQLMNNPLVSF